MYCEQFGTTIFIRCDVSKYYFFVLSFITRQQQHEQLESAKYSLREFCQGIKSRSNIQTYYNPHTRELYANKPITFSSRGLSTSAEKKLSNALLSPVPCDKPIWNTWMSQWHLPSITVALELQLFDFIAESEQGLSVSQLSKKLSLSSDRGLKALLQALVASDYLERFNGSAVIYKCTPLSDTFLSKSTTPQFYWGEMLGGADGAAERHRQLIDTIKNDDIIGAAEEWETGELTFERAEELTQAFHSHSLPSAKGAAKMFPISNTKHLLDIGGGSGCYSAAFVEANRQLHATVMDLPPVCKVTKEKYFNNIVNDMGEREERLHTLPKDMFKDNWPEPNDGYDAIFFSNILHDWSMETCRELLQKSFKALPSGGELLLHEMLLDSNEITPACFSIHMAVYTRGQQFFFEELKDMAEDAGFVDLRNSPTHGYYSIISAKKP